MSSNNSLRQNRLKREISLDELGRTTKVPRAYLEMIDDGRLDELPAGLYGRSYVKAFAAAVGVSAEQALAECSAQLVDVPDPLPAMREITRERTPPTLSAAIAERVREWYVARDASKPVRLPGTVYVAAGLDALLLFLLNAFIVGLAANACQVPVEALVRLAGGAMGSIGAFTCVMYFALLGGIGGQTLGMRICGTSLAAYPRPLNLRAIGGRAVEALLGGSSVVVDWLCSSELPKQRESTV